MERDLEVPPERIGRWLSGFAERHGGPPEAVPAPGGVRFTAPDGAVADCRLPFPPEEAPADAAGLEAAARTEQWVGVVLARLGGHAVGVFHGDRLVASKVGSRHVQGRTAAGGWSQQRFARRRQNQAREAQASAAGTAARVLSPYRERLRAVVLGGDRRSLATVSADPRLRWMEPMLAERVLNVPDPRHAVLAATPADFRAVRIHLTEPE
ncbi:MAG: hypothetical protein GEV11_09345 [Streptosporangiales bacterium]|nr:hypothetical protein [Streptosporangiales bacterium]